MTTNATLILSAAVLVAFIGPFALFATGVSRLRAEQKPSWRWDFKLTAVSTLLYTIAFNLTFFVQELFLVVPKALTPGLQPTLFHNNHTWEGHHALASLFQGTGALATMIVAVICAWLIHRRGARSKMLQLFLIWMTYCGFFMALPQIAIGALSSGSDLGMAMDYLGIGPTAKTLAALVALLSTAALAMAFTHPLLALCDDEAALASARGRMRFVFQTATLPAIAAIALIVPYRVPREWIEVLIMPIWVSLFGVAWIQANTWRVEEVRASKLTNVDSIARVVVAALALLLVFQFILRPGVRFY